MLSPCKACGSSPIREKQLNGAWAVVCTGCSRISPQSFDGNETMWWNRENPAVAASVSLNPCRGCLVSPVLSGSIPGVIRCSGGCVIASPSAEVWNERNPAVPGVAASPLRLNPCVSCFGFPSWDQSGSVSCRVICCRAAPSGEEWNKMNPLPEMNKCSDCGEAPYLRGAGVLYAVAECVCGKIVQAATVASAVEKWNLEHPALPAAAPCRSCEWPTPALLESDGRYRLYCYSCGGVSGFRDTKEGAVESWNSAAAPSLSLNPCQSCGSQPERRDLGGDLYRMECTGCDGWSSASYIRKEEECWNEENPDRPEPASCPLCQSREIEIEWKSNLCSALCNRCGYRGGAAGMSADAYGEFRKKPKLLPCPLCGKEVSEPKCPDCLVSAPYQNWQGFKRPAPKPPYVSSCRSCAGDASIRLSPDGLYYFTCDSCFMRGPNMKSEDLAREKWNELSDCACEEEPF